MVVLFLILRETPKTPREIAVRRAKIAITLHMLHDLARKEVSNKLTSLILSSGERAKLLRKKLREKAPNKFKKAPTIKLKEFVLQHPEKALEAIDEFESELNKTQLGPNVVFPFYDDLKQLRRGFLHIENIKTKRDKIIENLISMEEEFAGKKLTKKKRQEKKKAIKELIERHATKENKERLSRRISSSKFGRIMEIPVDKKPSDILREINTIPLQFNEKTEEQISINLQWILESVFKFSTTNKKSRKART